MKDLLLDVAYVGNKGTKLNGFRNLNQRAVITNANGSQAAGARLTRLSATFSGWRTACGRATTRCRRDWRSVSRDGLSALVSYTWGKALTESPDHISTSGGGPVLTPAHSANRRTARNLKRRSRAGRVRHQTSLRGQLHLGAAVWSRAEVGLMIGASAADLVSRRLAGDRHPCASERPRVDGYFRRQQRAQYRRRTAGAAEPDRQPGLA